MYEFSDFNDDDEEAALSSTSAVNETTCTTENQLAAALHVRKAGKFWCVCVPLPGRPASAWKACIGSRVCLSFDLGWLCS